MPPTSPVPTGPNKAGVPDVEPSATRELRRAARRHVSVGCSHVHLIAEVSQRPDRHSAERVHTVVQVAGHHFVAEHRLAPVRVAGSGPARVLHRHPGRGRAEDGVVSGHRVGPGKHRVRRAGPGHQPALLPDRADAEDVTHFVEHGEVKPRRWLRAPRGRRCRTASSRGPGGVTRYGPDPASPDREPRPGRRWPAPGRVDQHVVHRDAVVGGVGQVASDDLRPPVRGLLEDRLLIRREAGRPQGDLEPARCRWRGDRRNWRRGNRRRADRKGR